jgi:hypothetical protein
MGTPTRRAVLKGTAAVAGLADPAQAAPAGPSGGYPKANFVQDVPLPEARVLAAVQKAITGVELRRAGGAAGVEDAAVVVAHPHQVARLILAAARVGARY